MERRLNALLRSREATVEVGLFEDSRYPDGTKVARVGNAHEFGVGVPMRPFMAQAVPDIIRTVREENKNIVHSDDGVPNRPELDELGWEAAQDVKDSITRLMHPPNSPATIRRKGMNNPLIDTGQMRDEVRAEVK